MSRIAEKAFGDEPTKYPEHPGWKESTTSRDAAIAIAPQAPNLRQMVYRALKAAGPSGLTADEIATKVGRSVLAIRPRVTELSLEGSIIPTGERRRNESNQTAKVWRTKLEQPDR